ncbi:MAG: pilin [Patescibacteria group bacterium]
MIGLNRKNKIYTLIIIFIISLFFSLAFPVLAAEVPEGLVPLECAGNQYAKGACGLCSFIKMFVKAADILVGLSGVFLILMFIFGGFVMITAYGNETRVKWGKDALVAAVIGIFIIMLAWTLINTIIYSFYGITSPGVDSTYNRFTGKSLNQWGQCAIPNK